MPKTDEGSFRISVELPVGQNLNQTDKVVRQLEKYLATIPEVTNCLSSASSSSSNNGSLSVQLVDRKDRKRNVWEITDEVRGYPKMYVMLVRVNETQSSVSGVSGNYGGGGAVQVELLGSNMDSLVKASY